MSKKRPVLPNPIELNDAEEAARTKGGELLFYIVVNSKGEFFRAKGYQGYGASWVDDVKKARVYSKIGSARSIVTFFSKNYSYDPPKILEIGACGRRYVI